MAGEAGSLATDLRMPALGIAAWSGGLAGFLLPHPVTAALGLLAAGLLLQRWRGRSALTLTACLLTVVAAASVATLRVEANRRSPVAQPRPWSTSTPPGRASWRHCPE